MDPNTQAYYQSALKLGLPVVENTAIEGFTLTLGKNNYYFFNYVTPNNNSAGTIIAGNKLLTNALLRYANIPVPKGRYVYVEGFDLDRLIDITRDLKYPLVVKPLSWSSKGRD